jgi:hypothetical protein
MGRLASRARQHFLIFNLHHSLGGSGGTSLSNWGLPAREVIIINYKNKNPGPDFHVGTVCWERFLAGLTRPPVMLEYSVPRMSKLTATGRAGLSGVMTRMASHGGRYLPVQ